MFRFAQIEYLWLLGLIPLMVALAWASARRNQRRLRRFGEPTTLRRLFSGGANDRLRTALHGVVVALLALAAARPQFGSRLREASERGIELMLVVDVSNSMLSEDFQPNRLERTKYAIDKLLDGLHQDRVGLVVFAGDAVVQLPITADYQMARALAAKISPALVSVQGTDLGSAISIASLSFSQAAAQNPLGRVMILITDGEAHDAGALEAAKRAAEQGIRIFTIGIGTPEGAVVKINGEALRHEGELVVSKLNEELLQQIASATDGVYLRSTNASMGFDQILRRIEKLDKGELATLRFEQFDEKFGWPLGLALLLLVAEILLPLWPQARSAAASKQGEESPGNAGHHPG